MLAASSPTFESAPCLEAIRLISAPASNSEPTGSLLHEPRRRAGLAALGLMCWIAVVTVQAQHLVPDHSFNPVVTQDGGVPRQVFALPDGKLLVQGRLHAVDGALRNQLARLLPNGAPDPGFVADPGASSSISAMAVQSDGKMVIAGEFSEVNGVTRHGLARLNADGSVDGGFDAGAGLKAGALTGGTSVVRTQNDGRIVVAGIFDRVAGRAQRGVARFLPDGRLDEPFLVNVTGEPPADLWAGFGIYDLIVQPDGKILLAGDFKEINGTARRSLARLNADGTVDADFRPELTGDFRVTVTTMARQPDGRILILGGFRQVNGQPAFEMARLEANGQIDPSFTSPLSGEFSYGSSGSISVNKDGDILLATSLPQAVLRLHPNGTPNDAFKVEISGPLGDLMPTALWLDDGRALVWGSLTSVGGLPVAGLARVQGNGSPDATFNARLQTVGGITALTRQPDGRWLLGGNFTRVNGVPRAGIARVEADGALDASFDAGKALTDFAPGFFAVQKDGRVLVAVTPAPGSATKGPALFRLNANGSHDDTFASPLRPNQQGLLGVRALKLRDDQSILVGGDFAAFRLSFQNLARLTPTGSLDKSFDTFTGANGPVTALAEDPDGTVVICGEFTAVNDVPRQGLARLKSDGTVDPGFNPGVSDSSPNLRLNDLRVLADRRMILGGRFDQVAGQPRRSVARLLTDGVADPDFVPGSGPAFYVAPFFVAASVSVICPLPAGDFLVGGTFRYYDGLPRIALARLTAEGKLDQTLNAGLFTTVLSGQYVQRCVVQPDGGVVAGGFFSHAGGRMHLGLVRWLPTTVAKLGPPTGSSGNRKLGLLGSPGRLYDVETSADLTDWHPFKTVAAPGRLDPVPDPAEAPRRYYRARLNTP